MEDDTILPSVSDAYAALQNFNSSRKSAEDYLKQSNDTYDVNGAKNNVGALQGLVSNLRNSAAAVNPSVTGRTSGTFTTEGQRQALVAKESQPILNSLGQQQNALMDAEDNQQYAMNQANQMASLLTAQDQQKYSDLFNQYNVANSVDQFNKQQQAQAAALAEQQRQFNESLAEQRRQFDLTPRGGGGGINLGALGGGGAGVGGGQLLGGATTNNPGKSKQDQDYSFVKSLVDGINSGSSETGVLLGQTLAAARQGNERSKDIMRAFYQLKGIPIPQNFRSFL